MILEPQTRNYHWTQHAREKLKYYRLTEQRIKRVLRNPVRAEKGVAPDTTAVMQPITKKGKTTQEIWAMYQDRGNERVVITAWRYPGKSPIRGQIPIPEDIRHSLQDLIAEQNLLS